MVWGEGLIRSAFPALFNLAVHKEAMVRDVWDNSRRGGGWSPCFTRSFNDWELVEVENLVQTIQSLKVTPSFEDKLIWKESKADNYSMKLM